MTRLNFLACSFGLIAAAALACATPVLASENSSLAVNPVRNAVIAMTVADAAPLAAVAVRSEPRVAAETLGKPEATGAMAAMRPAPVRRARAVVYDRRVRIARNDFDGCSGCGSRHAVLMLGIGY